MMQLIDLFQENGWKITFASAAADSPFMVNFEESEINKVSIRMNDASFDEFVKDLNPDVVIFDRFMTEEQFGWRVTEQCPDALRILDTEDLHCLRFARRQAWKQGREMKTEDLHSDIAKREIAAIWRSDLSLIISEFEMDLLQEHFKVSESLLHYLPFLLNEISDEDIRRWPKFEERQHFISIGNFLHQPNWNSALYLKEEIWPLIRKNLPIAELHMYGAYTSQKVNQLHNEREGFLIKGRADNAHEVIQKAKVMLAPLRFGAGLKGKLIDAMQCGTPSVTTKIGAEAMHGDLPWPGEITESATKIADAAVDLYINEIKWKEAQQYGIKIINQLYSAKKIGENLITKVNHLMKNLEAHRNKNFMGSMLQHHTLASTRFMSKWIEEKQGKSG